MNNANNKAQKIDALIKESTNILIVGHNNSDPDSLSATIGMQRIIENHYAKKVQSISERIPESLKFIPGYGDVINGGLLDRITNGGYDLLILLDFNQWHMMSKSDNEAIQEQITMQQFPIILIDHHFVENVDIESDVYFHENPTSASANVHQIFHTLLGVEILPEIAEPLLIGVLADTNRFKYKYGAQTESTVLRIAADLVDKSTQSIEQISVALDRIDSRQLQLIAKFTENMIIHTENIAYTTLSEEDIATGNIDTTKLGDSANYIANNILTYVDDVKQAFIVYPRFVAEDTFTVRFRSNSPDFPINQWAEELGGGGHPQSGAALVKALTIEEALEKILEVIDRV